MRSAVKTTKPSDVYGWQEVEQNLVHKVLSLSNFQVWATCVLSQRLDRVQFTRYKGREKICILAIF
ncbi:hypothetical protein DDV21_002965 [Streptococcus chenjunshii]|uniref:Uncharacterized protein n=1 Tax=Streptococcus chenjunshii TaxID=2173853 RepID=A0A372KMQ5_9STRE|nr:hypothetical protein DDV21_002965 [Streptococcus chenjunshii]RFU51204.1 hypothetical protein DDV22_04915 [Streptococcus chenjunshii]RFU53256.1 hypothetical protein DDV23_05190 [Streptococcus chenjunshii]